jgi:hypothetical protein
VGKDAPIELRIWHNDEGLRQVAAEAGLLNLFWRTREIEIPNNKYQTNHNDRNSKFQTCFGH